jgi:hypothetical protein
MTIKVSCKVEAPEGMELEVIEVHEGVELQRYRVANGTEVPLTDLYGLRTLLLRTAFTAAPVEPQPGKQHHGALVDVPADPGLEDGDLNGDDPELDALVDSVLSAGQNVLDLVEKLVESNGEPIQLQVYDELLIAHGDYKKACALADAREEYLNRAEGAA